jgi:hypothetical protein
MQLLAMLFSDSYHLNILLCSLLKAGKTLPGKILLNLKESTASARDSQPGMTSASSAEYQGFNSGIAGTSGTVEVCIT